MKKILAFVACLIVAACGGAGENSTTSDTSSSSRPTASVVSYYGQLTPAEAALLGPDVDGNGVRDDVDTWIAQTFPDAVSRNAATAEAQWLTWSILRGARGSPTTSDEINAWAAAVSCGLEVSDQAMGSASPSTDQWKTILLNTYLRTKSYYTWDASTSGLPRSISMTPCTQVTKVTTP